MIIFPDWSDLSNVSSSTRASWEGELGIREKYRSYFEGLIFKERMQLEQPSGEEQPLVYPLGLNLVKMLCLAQTDALFGEWEDQIVRFETKQEVPPSEDHTKAIALLSNILQNSNANSMLWEVGLDRNIYGGGVIKIQPSITDGAHIKWMRVPLESFFPIWDPDDPDTLLECWVVIAMTAEQANAKYGIGGSAEIVYRVEHWTKFIYENTIDGVKVEAFSGVNPWGFIPFVYIPHCRTTTFWGLSLTEDIIPVQDELNGVMADAGEALNYNSHPVRWGMNLPKAFNTKNFPLAPNALWDLGRQMPGADKPEIGILEAKNPVHPQTFEYVKFLYDWARTGAFTPPIAFGEDNGGGQRSGQTLEVRMIPLIRANKRSRAYMGAGLQKAIWMSATILKQKHFSDVPSRALEKILAGEVAPRFMPVLPQDHQAIVDEVVKLSTLDPERISLETSQKILGRGPGEVDRIKADLKDKELQSEKAKAEIEGAKAKSQGPNADGQKSSDPKKVLEGMQGKDHPQG